MQSARKTALARTLRKRDTWAEKLMWSWLRDRRFTNHKFRRQYPVGQYVLDFFCLEARLDIEVDGSLHGLPLRRAMDIQRDAWLEHRRVKVLRFWNSELRRERQLVRDIIWRMLQERAPREIPEYWGPAPGQSGGPTPAKC